MSLIADTAFPRSKELLQKIITPAKVGDRYQEDLNMINNALANSDAVVTARQAVEWGMHSLQSVFARLPVPLPYDPLYTQCLLKLIFHLFMLNRIRIVL
jgi:hypothetical protein